MLIAVTKMQVPAAHQQTVLDGFEKAAPSLKRFSGFLGLEMWTGEDNTILAVSRWESQEALDEYLKNDVFTQHHGGASSEQRTLGQVSYYTAKVLS